MNENLTMGLDTLLDNAKALCSGETDRICCLANLSALIMQSMPRINWAGFYLMKQGELILGPFQGKTGLHAYRLRQRCMRNRPQKNECLVVRDVHQFPGHIACDEASRSEIVLPLVYQSKSLAFWISTLRFPTVSGRRKKPSCASWAPGLALYFK